SRTLVLVEQILASLVDQVPIEVHLIEVGPLAPQLGSALYRSHLPAAIEAELRVIESADVLIVASPVYRGSYTGLFKHLFDLVHQEALIDVPVLLAATGGSERHSLVIDHQLRPLFSFFQTRTAPLGVYASESDFKGYELSSAALRERIALAVERVLPLISVQGARAAAAAEAPIPLAA
ncbi:MAG: FMN reductase, partial [Curvibacter sp.]|nr:FMN reductase [Curvibacter sp.]